MPFDVNEFRSALVNDGARPNLFRCFVNFPAALGATAATQQLTFMARTAQLPGSSINQVPMMYFGRELKFAGNRTFQDWTITVINDEGFPIKDQFERWHHSINSHISNVRTLVSPIDYTADMFVTQYRKDGGIDKEYTFKSAFPIDISPIELDWGSNDSIEEFSVTFTYQWWEARTTESLNGGRTGRQVQFGVPPT